MSERMSEPEKGVNRQSPERGRGGEPTGTPTTGRAERPQPRIIQLDRVMKKDELAIHQGAADALTQAGLGTQKYTIAEKQIIPATGEQVGADSPFVVVTYSGQEDTVRLFDVINSAKVAKLDAEKGKKSQEEIEQAVKDAIKQGVDIQLRQEAYFRYRNSL